MGAPKDLVQIVIGYGATGSALVSSGVDKIIFVGSPSVGAIVARTAAATLTPVVLELGGKDPFVVCEDCDVPSILQTACRGVWQNMGQVLLSRLSASSFFYCHLAFHIFFFLIFIIIFYSFYCTILTFHLMCAVELCRTRAFLCIRVSL